MIFQLRNVKYRQILHIPSLELPTSRVVCVFGQSGSGKTTLLRLLNNLISPDEGRILYRGRDLVEQNPIDLRREVVMLPQTPIVFEGTIRENLLIGLRFSQKPLVEDRRLTDVLREVSLAKGLGVDAKKLSGGEKQRLALARMLLLEPPVLLLDEPSASLDEETERLVIEKVVDYSKRTSTTVVMVTHSKGVVERFAEVIINLANGRVTAVREVAK